jgi:hypothetical protein
MILTKYSQKDYAGRYNLRKAEKQLILTGLKKTNESLKLSVMLQMEELDLLAAMVRHGIVVT